MNSQNKRTRPLYYVVGTDTGSGKTVLSLLLMQFFYEMGASPFYIKPFQTGCRDVYDTDSDALFVYKNVSALAIKDPAESVIYCFKNPKAPYFAARDEGRFVSMEVVLREIDKRGRDHSPLIIEAAGGILVPLTEDLMVVDTIRMIGASPIVAARAGLGTINHTLLTFETMDKLGLEPASIVLIDSEKHGASDDMIAENIEAIEKHSGIRVAGVIGRITNFKNPPRTCYKPLENMFAKPV